MRRVFGPRGGAARQDVLAATDVNVNWNYEEDFAPWVAYRKEKKKGVKKAEDGGTEKPKDKGEGRRPNTTRHRRNTDLRHTFYWRDSE